MTREEFIKVLEDGGYPYEIEGDKIVVTYKGEVDLDSLKTLPPGVEFKNRGYVNLGSLKTLPPGVEFNNRGDVYLKSLKTINSGAEFNNGGSVYLGSLKTIPHGVEFNNGGSVDLDSLTGSWFSGWDSNIDGISPNTLLNGMIKRGIFL